MTLNKRTKILIFVAVAVITVILVYWFYSSTKKQPELQQSVLYLPEPVYINPVNDSKFSISFSPNLSLDNLPTELPVFRIEKAAMSMDEADALAKRLGISSKAIITNSIIGGTTYIYSGIGPYLRILPEQRIIDYKSGAMPGLIFAGEPEESVFVPLAIDYLIDKGFIKDKNEVVFDRFRSFFLEPGGHGYMSDVKPNLVSVSFIKKIEGISLLGSTHENGVVNVFFNNSREVVSVYFDGLSQVVEIGKYELKDSGQIKSESSEMSLQSINNGAENEDHYDQIRNILVEKVSLAYIQEYEGNQEILQPSYVIEGTATLTKGSKTVPVTLYLPALKR